MPAIGGTAFAIRRTGTVVLIRTVADEAILIAPGLVIAVANVASRIFIRLFQAIAALAQRGLAGALIIIGAEAALVGAVTAAPARREPGALVQTQLGTSECGKLIDRCGRNTDIAIFAAANRAAAAPRSRRPRRIKGPGTGMPAIISTAQLRERISWITGFARF